MKTYEMYKRNSTNKCADCGKKNREVSDKEWVIDYRNSPGYKLGDTTREYLCLNCGDIINQHNINEENERARRHKEERDLTISEKSDKLPAELRQLWDDLEPKVASEDLDVKDVKRIHALKKEINKFLKEEKKVDINSDYWTKINIASTLLQNSPTDLDNFIKENASPRTIDIANKGKYSRIRDCHHEKGIEPCTDDPTFFCCSYCWDTESPKFLEKLRSQQRVNINKLLDEYNINSIEFCKISNNYKRLLDKFTTQQELKSVYQAAEKDLQTFLKEKKGIRMKTSREQNQSQQSKLLSQIHQLESNPTKNQTELDSKKQQLKDLQNKEKTLIKSLPLDIQITILEEEIKALSNKPTKTKAEEALLVDKKKELEELLKKQSNSNTNKPKDRTGIYIGLGIVGALLVLGIFILARIRKKKY